MGELVDRDQEHLRLLEIGYYVMAGTVGFFSLFALIYIALGGLLLSGVVPKTPGAEGVPGFLGGVFLGIGIAFFVLGFTYAFLMYLAGRGLKRRQRRVLCLVMAGLCCLQIPWGTILGIFAINVLNRSTVIRLFENPVN
jgi:hypothetical protein